MEKISKKIIITILTSIFILIFLLILLFAKKQDSQKIKEIIIQAENNFAQTKYQDAEQLYQQAYEIHHTEFLKARLKILNNLNKIQMILAQGSETELEKLLQVGKQENWDQDNIDIFTAHCQNFIMEFQRIRDYQQQIQELLQLAKNKKDTGSSIKKIIAKSRQHGTSLLPLIEAIIAEIKTGATYALQLLWNYKESLQVTNTTISTAIGITPETRLESVQNFIQQDNTCIYILTKILEKKERQNIAQHYIQNINFKNVNQVEENIKIALQFYPQSKETHQKYAHFLTTQEKYIQAIHEYEQTKDIFQQNIENEQAWCMFLQNELPQAVQTWNHILKKNKDHEETHFALSLFYIFRGNIPQAISHMQQLDKQGISHQKQLLQAIFHTDSTIINKLLPTFPTHLQPSISICQAILHYSKNQIQESQCIFQKFSNYPISQVYLRQIQKSTDNKQQQDTIEKSPSILFYSKIFKENIEITLPAEWQQLWEKTGPTNFSKEK